MNLSDAIALCAVLISGIVPLLTLTGMHKDSRDSAHSQGERDGKIDAAIVTLTDIAKDHEHRLREGGL